LESSINELVERVQVLANQAFVLEEGVQHHVSVFFRYFSQLQPSPAIPRLGFRERVLVRVSSNSLISSDCWVIPT
jgi:hypothetical protein